MIVHERIDAVAPLAVAPAVLREQAFDRAMAGAGGVSFARADADTINRVAELDGLQKSATVAERLAALKAQQAA